MQARKALKALKGVVLLQAVIRGENVRRQIITHMKSLQSILKPQVHQMRVSGADENCVHGNEIQSFSPEKMVVNKENNDKARILPTILLYVLIMLGHKDDVFSMLVVFSLDAKATTPGNTACLQKKIWKSHGYKRKMLA